MPQGQVGIGVNQAGGEPRSHIGAGKVGLRPLCCLLRVAAEIVVFRQRDVPLGTSCHSLHHGKAFPWLEWRVHQGHQAGNIQRSSGLLFLPTGDPGVLGLFRLHRNRPRFSKFLCTGDAPINTELLHHPVRKTPFFRSLPHSEVFHTFPPISMRLCFIIIRNRASLQDASCLCMASFCLWLWAAILSKPVNILSIHADSVSRFNIIVCDTPFSQRGQFAGIYGAVPPKPPEAVPAPGGASGSFSTIPCVLSF